jgi:hypothetical protein
MNSNILQEHIRKVLREKLNESTYLRRRVDMSTIDKKFLTNLNIVTDKYIRKHNGYCSFNVFRTTVISYLIDDYRDNLFDDDYDNFPYDEVYNFLLNHFYDKIKDRYVEVFGGDIQESIRKVLREDNNLLPMIRRRVPHDDLEREFIESLDKSSGMLVSVSQNGGFIRTQESFEHITISMMMDGIHHELHSTTPENSDWYDDVFNNLRDYYKHRINVRYNNLLLDL